MVSQTVASRPEGGEIAANEPAKSAAVSQERGAAFGLLNEEY